MNHKRKTSSALLASVGLIAASTLSHAAVITNGLIGEYTFESSNSNDSTGIIGNGVDNGTPTYTTTSGRSGIVLNISPTNFITIADNANIPSGADPRTVSFWLKVDVNADSAGPFRSGQNSNGQDFSIETTGSNNSMRFNGWNADVPFTANPGVDQWTYVAVTYDGTTLRTYINGSPTESSAEALNTGTNGIKFGGTRITRSDGDNGTFSIDDVLVYDRALSDAEVLQNIPEPSSMLLSGLGLIGLIGVRRRQR